MQSLEKNGYSKQEVMNVLHSRRGPRKLRFRYDLLDKTNRFIKTLTNVVSGEVSMDSLADIKRTARFSIKDDESIDFLSDRIQPYIEIEMPYKVIGSKPNNIALNKQVTLEPGATVDPGSPPASVITNGSTSTYEFLDGDPSNDGTPQWVEIDLGKEFLVNQIKVWHYYDDGRTYNTKCEVSIDKVNWYTVFDSDINGVYAESESGKTHGFTPKNVRYVRDHLFGSNVNPFNHWVEIQVFEANVLDRWIPFPLGIFLLSSPKRKDRTNGVFREVEAYGGLIILRDDKFETTYAVNEGTKYYDAIIELLSSSGITKYNIEYTDAALQRSIEFEPGKEKLFAINELLRQINYTPIYDDVNGSFTSSPYRSPAIKSIDYSYRDDDLSVMYQGVEEELDLFEIPNKWVVVCSNPEQDPLGSTYSNENEDSPLSIVNRGRTIVDYREVTDIADQQTLDAYVQRIAFEASQVYGRISFETAIMPMHDYADLLEIDYSPLNILGKYAETSWTIPLITGGKMKHELRKVVTI